jgi:hypothetical protein
VSLLERRGWQREGIADGGIFTCHIKEFPALGVTAAVQYDGIPVGSIEDAEPQAIEHCYVVPGMPRERQWEYGDARADALRWEHVDPIVRCEVLTTLEAISARAQS